jgi:hypothetical protein
VKAAAGFALATCLCGLASADTLLPSATGTTWKYQMTQEFGEGVHPSAAENAKVDSDAKVRAPINMFISGTEKIDGVETIKYEMHRQGHVQLIEFLKVDEDRVTAMARSDSEGEMYKLVPPQKILGLPPHEGDKWNYNGKVGEIETTQSFEIVGRESIDVPAGKFDAYHLRLTQLAPIPPKVTEDRWFVPNLGYVKILTEMMRGDGRLLQRINLELSERPRLGERPVVGSIPAEKKPLHAALAKALTAEPTTSFAHDLPKIYARWQGEALQKGDKIRCVWIAEDVGDVAPKDFKVDETSTTADGARAFGTFTLSKPNKGWPVGKYRVEFYEGDKLVEAVRFQIEK